MELKVIALVFRKYFTHGERERERERERKSARVDLRRLMNTIALVVSPVSLFYFIRRVRMCSFKTRTPFYLYRSGSTSRTISVGGRPNASSRSSIGSYPIK